MKLLDQIQGLWGRTLSPIEIQSIIGFTELYDDKTILQSAMMALDKEKPFPYMKPYMKKVLSTYKPKEQEEPSGSEWLDNFNKRFK